MADDTPESTRIRELQDRVASLEETNKHLLEERLKEEARRIDRATASKALRSEFKNKDEFLAAKFADWLLQAGPEYRLVTPANDLGGDVIWMYHEDLGVYRPDGVTWMEQQVREIMGQDTKANYYGEVSKHTRVSTYMDPTEFSDDPTLIVLENGTYSVSAKQLLPHSPVFKAKTRIPVAYDPAADCPAIKAFLQRVAPKDLAFLQEWVGYHLLKDYRFQRCVVLVGEGDNGKSTLLCLLTRFLGPENVTGQSLYSLTTNRFAPAELQGRLANIAADIGPDEIKHTGVIKMLTGGDWITAERKHQQPFKFLNYAKMSFSCNQLPKTPDVTLAFFKRFIALTFNEVIPKAEQDPQLLEKLTTPEELSGLLNWALEGLARLLDKGGFSEGTALERKELYMRMSDPVTGFVNDCISIDDPEAVTEKQEVLNAFFQYCRSRGFVPASDKTFHTEFKKLTYCKETQIRGKGSLRPRVYKGIQLINVTGVTDVTAFPCLILDNYSQSQYENPVTPVTPVTEPVTDTNRVHIGDASEAPKVGSDLPTAEPEASPPPNPTSNPGALVTALSRLILALGVMEKKTGEAVRGEDLRAHLKWDQASFDRILGVVMRDGTVFSPRPGCYRRTA